MVEELKEQLQSEALLGTAYPSLVDQLVGNTAQRMTIRASRQNLAKNNGEVSSRDAVILTSTLP